jgi:hypothetical protein
MHKYKLVFFVIAAIPLLFLAACSAQAGEISAGMGDEVSLKAGQTETIKGEPLKIKFIDVASDSRCPTGVTCIWAGEVKCNVEITSVEGVEPQALVQSGGSSGFASLNYKEYRLDFDVQPYPAAGKEIAGGDYRLKLKVTK